MKTINTIEYIIKMRSDHPRHWVMMVKRNHPEIHQKILAYDCHHVLNAGSNSQMYYNYCNGVVSIPVCNITGTPLKFVNTTWNYRKYGSRGVATDSDIKARAETRKSRTYDYSIYGEIGNILTRCQGLCEMPLALLSKALTDAIGDTVNGGGILSTIVAGYEHLVYHVVEYQRVNSIDSFVEAVYCIVNGTTPRKCKITGNSADFISFKDGYSEYSTDPDNSELIVAKRRDTLSDKYLKALNSYEPLPRKVLQSIVGKIMVDEYSDLVNNPRQYFNVKYPQLLIGVENATDYMPDVKFTEKLYHVCNGLTEIPLNKFKNPAKFETFLNGYRMCENAYTCSNVEIEIRQYISKIYDGLVISNDKSALQNRQELDIYLPDLRIGVEVNGEYYHSDSFKDKSYHLNKTDRGKSLGIRVFHIWVGEWERTPKIVKGMLLNLIGTCENVIHARKCVISDISAKVKNEFLVANHLQGKDNSKYKLGAFYDGELVAVMTFGSRQISKKNQFELIRFCSKINCRVVGGASKLFKNFIKHHDVDEIVTYADNRWSRGNLYKMLGFELSHMSAISYYYYKAGIMYHRTSFQKHKLEKRLSIFDSNMSESANMKANGYSRVWDCGQYVYRWTRS